MNLALWRKSLLEARTLLAGSLLLMLAFPGVFIWLTAQIPIGNLKAILNLLPPVAERLSSVPLSQLATSAGRIAVLYDHPLVLVIMSSWAIARGSDAVSGELGRGTLEMVLAQPVTRLSVLASHAAITVLGAASLAGAIWIGTFVGLASMTLEDPVSAREFIPAALNLFCLTLLLGAFSTLVSAPDRYRSRTVGLVVAFYVLSILAKLVARGSARFTWLAYVSFITPFEPQVVVSKPETAWQWWVARPDGSWALGGLGNDAVLVALAVTCYVTAAVIFSRRDLPAPL